MLSRNAKEHGRRTIEVLRERGWTQRHYADECGVCIYGAMILADNQNNDLASPYDQRYAETCELARKLRMMIARDAYYFDDASLVSWNDMPDRKVEDVIELIEEAMA